MDLLRKYFPDFSEREIKQFKILSSNLKEWNTKINLISRKDIDLLEERHLLHSLSIAKFIQFNPGTKIIDIGTGGGFPGLPLAIIFPECTFTLVDSIAKKVKVVNELSSALGLKNVNGIWSRAENINEKYDFVVSRAVAAFPQFYNWTKNLLAEGSKNNRKNGIIYLKGGDLSQELAGFGNRIVIEAIKQWFEEEWFHEKKIVYWS